jgi:hypothetical protein
MSSKKHSRNGFLKSFHSYRAASSVTDGAIESFYSGLNCPKSLACWLLYSNNEHQQLLDIGFDPLHYNNAAELRDAYQAVLLLSKSTFLKVDVDRKAAAFSKFFDFEKQCAVTNARFRDLAFDPSFRGPNVWLLNATTRKIARILGEFSPEKFLDSGGWGPGVTTLIKGEDTSASNKFQLEAGITRDLYPHARKWISWYPHWSGHLHLERGDEWAHYEVGNHVVTVPKSAKIDRVIAIEPGINLWFQKSAGHMIRQRLRRFGVDLSDQGRNQLLCEAASISGDLATVDFSSASDSIALELVREILPPDWFEVLDLCRSRYGVIDGKPRRWAKFSSMGNGFTFELETLIFYAAALACCEFTGTEGEVSVYGDDVILPSSVYHTFASFCRFLGFTVNPAKSFSTGWFRESCGSHYYRGVCVKPIYLKDRVVGILSVYQLANAVRLLSHRRNCHNGCDSRLESTWLHLVRSVPGPLRLSTSRGYGDGGFIRNFDEATPSRAGFGVEGHLTLVLLETGIRVTHEGFGHYLAILWRSAEQASYGYKTLRGRTRMRLKPLLVRRWYDLGPWI